MRERPIAKYGRTSNIRIVHKEININDDNKKDKDHCDMVTVVIISNQLIDWLIDWLIDLNGMSSPSSVILCLGFRELSSL